MKSHLLNLLPHLARRAIISKQIDFQRSNLGKLINGWMQWINKGCGLSYKAFQKKTVKIPSKPFGFLVFLSFHFIHSIRIESNCLTIWQNNKQNWHQSLQHYRVCFVFVWLNVNEQKKNDYWFEYRIPKIHKMEIK